MYHYIVGGSLETFSYHYMHRHPLQLLRAPFGANGIRLCQQNG